MSLPTRATVQTLGTGSKSSVKFHGWSGWISSLQTDVDYFRRLGQAGNSGQGVGSVGAPSSVSAWKCETSFADAAATIAAIEGLKGTIVSVTDPWNRVIPRARVIEASARPVKGKGPVVAGTAQATVRVDATMVFERLPDE